MCSSLGGAELASGNEESWPEKEQEEEDGDNKRAILSFYEALNSRDLHVMKRLVSPDLEWWFHGPPTHQHIMFLLTGERPPPPTSSSKPSGEHNPSFFFAPVSITAVGSSFLIVEGYEKIGSVTWVHVWRVSDGIITQIREYFKTSVTVSVTRLDRPNSYSSSPPSSAATSSPSSAATSSPSSSSTDRLCPRIWQSKLCDQNSVPGLILSL